MTIETQPWREVLSNEAIWMDQLESLANPKVFFDKKNRDKGLGRVSWLQLSRWKVTDTQSVDGHRHGL